ncbi:hypothetical protein [Halomarina rubra]|uniref:RelE toxin-related domain-containing protein n=1 Tax=Halomarina rubra TaxID=2071873 RepID=A0ABD6AZW8_9EURY|nr:hypothetical protein [Halomarina rubra]
MSVTRPNQFRQQDGHVLSDGHAQYRWDCRTRERWTGYPVRVAWREAIPVVTPKTNGIAYCRLHERSRMVLVARWGFLKTVVPLWDFTERARERIWRQVREARDD